MTERIKRKAKNIRKPYDRVSQQGTLIRGAIYLNEMLPTSRKKLENISKKKRQHILKKLKQLESLLRKETQIQHLDIDKNKLRLLSSTRSVISLSKKIQPKLFRLATVEEYPTYDSFEVEIDFL
jgi:pyruvate formate-lyase activating enzyme-like uncharacterized protein